jgi:transposase
MSLAFEKGINENMPNSQIIIDKFHVFKHMNDALNQVRRDECINNKTLKKSRFLFLKSEDKLRDWQIEKRNNLLHLNPNTCCAFSAKLELEKIYNECYSFQDGKIRLEQLIISLLNSNIHPLIELGNMLYKHIDNICKYFDSRRTNAILEGFNSLIQNCKNRARGFKTFEYFKSIIYLVTSKLDFKKAFNNPLTVRYFH